MRTWHRSYVFMDGADELVFKNNDYVILKFDGNLKALTRTDYDPDYIEEPDREKYIHKHKLKKVLSDIAYHEKQIDLESLTRK